MNKPKLLIVDSDADYCTSLEKCFMESHEFDVQSSVQNGEDALNRVKEGDIGVILLNIVIPKDGLEVLRQIKNMDLPDPPKIFIHSAMNTDSVIGLTLSLGALYYFRRPIDPNVMVKRIRDFLSLDQNPRYEAFVSGTLQNDDKRDKRLEDIITSLIILVLIVVEFSIKQTIQHFVV